jgi:hypothetical protein
MAKRTTIKVSDKSTMTGKESPVCSALLIMGSWKNSFTDIQSNIIIAEALNTCNYDKVFKLSGYMISQKRVFLVLKLQQDDLHSKMLMFNQHLLAEIRKQLVFISSQVPEMTAQDLLQPDLKKLFRQYILKDQSLIRLLTGERVELPYYDPKLERLKHQVNSNPFCSVIDYSGAKGPVVIHIKN